MIGHPRLVPEQRRIMRPRNRSFLRALGYWLVCLVVALVVGVLLGGCAEGVRIGGPEHVAQVCPDVSPPTLVSYVNTPKVTEICAQGGLVQPSWGGCTVCFTTAVLRTCTVYVNGKPNEIAPDLLADEAQHVFDCVHKAGP